MEHKGLTSNFCAWRWINVGDVEIMDWDCAVVGTALPCKCMAELHAIAAALQVEE